MKRWALLLLFASAASAVVAAESTNTAFGQAIFEGEVVLSARLRHHDNALPASAFACVNCHSSTQANRFAPALTNPYLKVKRSRLGGPTASYDESSFCRLLKTSVAPNQVMTPQVMPQYDLSAEQCSALWRYLETQP